jgi:hypothetical protein
MQAAAKRPIPDNILRLMINGYFSNVRLSFFVPLDLLRAENLVQHYAESNNGETISLDSNGCFIRAEREKKVTIRNNSEFMCAAQAFGRVIKVCRPSDAASFDAFAGYLSTWACDINLQGLLAAWTTHCARVQTAATLPFPTANPWCPTGSPDLDKLDMQLYRDFAISSSRPFYDQSRDPRKQSRQREHHDNDQRGHRKHFRGNDGSSNPTSSSVSSSSNGSTSTQNVPESTCKYGAACESARCKRGHPEGRVTPSASGLSNNSGRGRRN